MNGIIMLVLSLSTTAVISKTEKAICIVPIADLLSQKMTLSKKPTILEGYKNIPASVTTKKKIPFPASNDCPRVLQLLYNEQVTILAQEHEQCYIETPYWHLTLQNVSKKNNRFWTLASNLLPVNRLNPEEQNSIPPAENSQLLSGSTVILKDFFYCPQTKLTYCAGTRFIIQKETAKQYTILIYDPELKKLITSHVPSCVCKKEGNNKNKRTLFLQTVRGWTGNAEKIIPYILGGSSVGERLSAEDFTVQKIKKNYCDLYTIPSYPSYPYQGVDCSSIIRCACLIAGIPLYATNSSSIASALEKLSPDDYPRNGDLISWKGHIAIISDVKKGLLIEARGYNHGYGFVHEIPYSEQLHGIETTDDLVTAYRNKKHIDRIDKLGQKRETISDLMILKLPVS